MELVEIKLLTNLTCCKEKKEQNEGNVNKKHNHLVLIVLVRLSSVMLHTCQHLFKRKT